MNGNISKDEEKKEEQAKSFVMAQFEGVGSAVFSMNMENTTPGQLMALSAYLEVYAKTFYSGSVQRSLEQKQKQELSVPRPEIEIAQK